MNLPEMERAILSNQLLIQTILNNTVPAPSWALEVNDPLVKAGLFVFGKKAGINDGSWFFGKCLVAPPTQDSHIDFDVQY